MLQAEVRRCLGRLREELGNQGLEAELSRGASLPPAEAVALGSGG